jgi:hypothetical protein
MMPIAGSIMPGVIEQRGVAWKTFSVGEDGASMIRTTLRLSAAFSAAQS